LSVISYKPIGFIECEQKYPNELPRQPGQVTNVATIKLNLDHNLDQCLQDLHLFSHIWVVFDFHKNTHWKSLVETPREQKKHGVFATRSPYRPNSIGISCVELVAINSNQITIKNHDLLNHTPVLDIKPYIPYSDCITTANSGWLKQEDKYKLNMTPLIKTQLEWLQSEGIHLENVIQSQLMFQPTNKKKKRITENGSFYFLHHRTWKIQFEIVDKSIMLHEIFSNYSKHELENHKDRYCDKAIHRKFNSKFEIS
jgi:tRNA-Thr(GGU) m(6)t(6)A37 methyltransferase TsaA